MGRARIRVPLVAELDYRDPIDLADPVELAVDPALHRGPVTRHESQPAVLRDLGFRICRVRHHDSTARIELGPDEIPRAFEPAVASAIERALADPEALARSGIVVA